MLLFYYRHSHDSTTILNLQVVVSWVVLYRCSQDNVEDKELKKVNIKLIALGDMSAAILLISVALDFQLMDSVTEAFGLPRFHFTSCPRCPYIIIHGW